MTWRPSILILSAVASLGSSLVFGAVGVGAGFWILPQSSMAIIAIAMAARYWLGLCVMTTALDILRANFRWRPIQWVPAATAIEVALVSAVLTAVTLAALLFLIVPGVIVALWWSQVPMLMLDNQARWFAASTESQALTRGRRLDILMLWIIVGGGFALLEWLTSLTAPAAGPDIIRALVRIASTAFSLSFLAATYHELERGAPASPAPSSVA